MKNFHFGVILVLKKCNITCQAKAHWREQGDIIESRHFNKKCTEKEKGSDKQKVSSIHSLFLELFFLSVMLF